MKLLKLKGLDEAKEDGLVCYRSSVQAWPDVHIFKWVYHLQGSCHPSLMVMELLFGVTRWKNVCWWAIYGEWKLTRILCHG
jgi:hypothetical protein